MKKILNILILLPVGLLTAGTASAQENTIEKTDKITFSNGTTKEGKVIAFSDDKIRFIHRGETLNYELNKNDILTISYGSGRTEVITPCVAEDVYAPLSKNRVAVLPIQYIGGENDDKTKEMEFVLQDIVIGYLSKSAGQMKFVGSADVNAMLLRNGINGFSIRQYTPKELAAVLQVEYIVMGNVLREKGPLVTNGRNNYTTRQSGEHHHGRDNVERRYHTNVSYITRQHFETRVSLFIYNQMGETIYNQSRRSILSNHNAYKNTIHYMLKRTPLYQR